MATQNGHPVPNPNRTIMVDRPQPRPTAPFRKKKSYIWLYLILGLILLAVVLAIVLIRKEQARSALEANTKKMSVPTVLVVHPQPGSPQVHLTLPGTVQAYIQSTVYAQVTGYLKRWLVDIGTPVHKGQLLAEIETPALDQQLRAAQATQVQNQADVDLAQITATRYNHLLHTAAVSQQDVDQMNGNLAVAQANLAAAQANVTGLQKTEAFKEVYAPFDGVITARDIDIGDLINAGTGSASQALFSIAQTSTLRIYVQVPELYSDEMVPGLSARLDLASSPGRQVTGTLVRTSKAINPTNLTLLAEVDVDNRDLKLLPGGYVQVHLDLTLTHPAPVLPGNTLIFRAHGTQVGTVDSNNIVHLKDIKIGRDFGTSIEISSGISLQDNVIVNPSDSLADGQKVQVQQQQPQPPPAAKPPTS